MPKTIHTPREMLICGKVEATVELLQALARFCPDDLQTSMIAKAIEQLHDIKQDGRRMEAKLGTRKQQVRELKTVVANVYCALNAIDPQTGPFLDTSLLHLVDDRIMEYGVEWLRHDDGSWPQPIVDPDA